MLYVDRAVGQFRKQLTSIIAVKGGYVEHRVQVHDHPHSNDRG